MNKRICVTLVLTMTLLMLSACGKKASAEGVTMSSKTVASTLYNEFKGKISTNNDVEAVVNELIESPVFKDISMGTVTLEEGYLTGFNSEIHGFSKAVMFAPNIGTIPFVGYIFETDDPQKLQEELKSHAQLNWNICTQADEMICEPVGDYVYFVMAPKSFD